MVQINDYIPVAGKSVIEDMYVISEKLKRKKILNINSTAVGGGVAEILSRIIPLMQQLGLDVRWDVIKGDEKFFMITKKFHNALHGVEVNFTADDFEYFLEINKQNLNSMNLEADIFFVHDPQPVALVEKNKEIKKHWAWRCHIDFTNPQKDLMEFLSTFIEQYECAVFSAPAFREN